MEDNNKKIYSQSLESIIMEQSLKDGSIDSDYHHRLKRGEARQVYYITNQKTQKRKKGVKNLRVVMPIALVVTLLSGGVLLVKNRIETKDIVKINYFSPTSRRDISVMFNQKKAGDIIDLLMDNNYQNIEYDDIKYVCEYIKNSEMGNYDKNASSILFNLEDYFSYKAYMNSEDTFHKQSYLLEKIGKLQKECYKVVDGRLETMSSKANDFLNYTLSIIFMYDTTVDLRGSGLVNMNTQSITSNYATKEEISTYQSLPLIIRYIIANQACTMLRHIDYKVDQRPSNYFGGLDKYSLIERLQEEMSSIKEYMENNVLFKSKSV